MAVGKKPANYVNKDDLIAEIILSKKRLRGSNHLTPTEALTDKLVLMLKMLVDRFAQSGKWRGYSYNDDYRSEAYLALCQNALKFDEQRFSNPFGYFTQIAKNSFLSYRDKEMRLRDIRDDMLQEQGSSPSMARQLDTDYTLVSSLRTERTPPDPRIPALRERIQLFTDVIKLVNGLTEADKEVDVQIGNLMNLPPSNYTSENKQAAKLVPAKHKHVVEADREVGGVFGTIVSISSPDNTSRSMRVVPKADSKRVPIALTTLALVMQRDLLNQELRLLESTKTRSVPAKADIDLNYAGKRKDTPEAIETTAVKSEKKRGRKPKK